MTLQGADAGCFGEACWLMMDYVRRDLQPRGQ
jgi:hypothetical protein